MLPQRKTVRLQTRDYGGDGSYFVTICTHERRCNLARFGPDERLSKFGEVVEHCWTEMLRKRPYVIDRHRVIMPNHVHVLFSVLRTDDEERARRSLPLHGFHGAGSPAPDSVATIIGGFKSAVTKTVNGLRATPGAKFWQRGYYEHVIRDDRDFAEVAEYIRNNPERWKLDRENIEAQPDKHEVEFWRSRLRLQV